MKKAKLINEIYKAMYPKKFNIENGTANEREKFVYSECQGFLSLIEYSVLGVDQIKKLWESSNLKFQ